MTAVAAPRPVPPPLLALVRRALAAEWTRLWTVRTTWWCVLAAAGLMVGMGFLLGRDVASDLGAPPPAHQAGQIALLLGQAALLSLVVLAVTSEHTTGAIASTLQWTARRPLVLLARVVVPVAVAVALGAVLALAADLAAVLAFSGLRLDAADTARSLALVAVVVASGALLAVGTALLLRTTAAALAVTLMLSLVLPPLLPGLGSALLTDVAALMPGTGTAYAMIGEPSEVGAAKAAALLVAWPVVALVAGAWSLLRRDAG